MASNSKLNDDDYFVGDFPGTNSPRHSGQKRTFRDFDDDEDDILISSKKSNIKAEETTPVGATAIILDLRQNLESCKNTLTTCQSDLEAAKSEIQTLKDQLEKAKKKESAYIVTVAKREKEISELKSAVRDLRAQFKPPLMEARWVLLDPLIHEEFTRLKNLVEEKDKKVKELEENIAAINFTPQSKMGKMLIEKCRKLREENEEIGYQEREGKMHELSMKLALQKTQNMEIRRRFEGLCNHMKGLTNDVEKSNEIVSILQERVEDKDVEIKQLKLQLQQKSAVEATCGLASVFF